MIVVRKLKNFDDVWKIVLGNSLDPDDEFLLTGEAMKELSVKLKEAGF